jgi:NhaA family Na+:H+ antiporter
MGTVAILVKFGVADQLLRASWGQMTGVAFPRGIGFTMSLFIGLLAFNDPVIPHHIKLGIEAPLWLVSSTTPFCAVAQSRQVIG